MRLVPSLGVRGTSLAQYISIFSRLRYARHPPTLIRGEWGEVGGLAWVQFSPHPTLRLSLPQLHYSHDYSVRVLSYSPFSLDLFQFGDNCCQFCPSG